MQATARPPGGQTSVLYIDDDEALCFLLRKSLARRGIGVVCASDGEGGLARLASGRFDVVVLDHYLIGETGLDILPRLIAVPHHPPVVYVTGAPDPAIAEEAKRRGAEEFVTKSAAIEFFDTLAAVIGETTARFRLRPDGGSDAR
ncbi:response regulator [Ensifer soli]|uniref:response regulator n=1 Tax=Ciceribacter sp. sgz301302 TaxID=3342379 RepID=UPI0035B6C2A7